jgi:hypothetical protein
MHAKLIQARTCEGCKAKFEHENPFYYECKLNGFECSKDGKPLGKCPKPKTNNELSKISIAQSRGEIVFTTNPVVDDKEVEMIGDLTKKEHDFMFSEPYSLDDLNE